MAKTLSANSVAATYEAYNNVVILDGIGPKNDGDVAATTYTVFVPETCVEYLGEFKQWTNNNWDAKAFKRADGSMMNVEERLAAIPQIAADFTPKAAKTQTPLRRAVQNILCRLNPTKVQGLSGAALVKACAADVELFLVKASLEKYRAQIDAELVAIANETSKRSLRGEGKNEEMGVGMAFETDETSTD